MKYQRPVAESYCKPIVTLDEVFRTGSFNRREFGRYLVDLAQVGDTGMLDLHRRIARQTTDRRHRA